MVFAVDRKRYYPRDNHKEHQIAVFRMCRIIKRELFPQFSVITFKTLLIKCYRDPEFSAWSIQS